jgi:hypothetical protein
MILTILGIWVMLSVVAAVPCAAVARAGFLEDRELFGNH